MESRPHRRLPGRARLIARTACRGAELAGGVRLPIQENGAVTAAIITQPTNDLRRDVLPLF